MPRKAQVSSLIRQIERQKKIIADARDKLRDLEEEISAIVEDCDEAEEALSQAVDALSKYL